jgi:hypothetical protein
MVDSMLETPLKNLKLGDALEIKRLNEYMNTGSKISK